ncbi:MAG: M20/M25/M40 family metallo-hydrolase, partial [Thermodesulfobacteriota bacterium]
FYMDCRVLPDISLASVLDEMRTVSARVGERFGVEITLKEEMKFEAPAPTPADALVVQALAQAVQEVYGIQARPVGIGGQTVAAFFRKRGLHAVVWEKIVQCAHAPNERISLENLVGNAKVFARMMI